MLNESKPQSALQPELLVLKALKGATQAKRVLNGSTWVTIYIWWFFETNADTAMMLLLPY